MPDLKVLHIHPKIGIGGVETYLCRLVAEQRRRGWEVGLLTAGGLFEERITGAGAHLFKLPVHKQIGEEYLAQAVEMVRSHGFELVHTHNYRAARLGRRMAGRLGAAYLMSVHGPRPIWHRALFRDWSRWVVAMSEGDRDNISAAGGISRDRVLMSFYGIDTDRFRPGLETDSLRAELGLPAGALPVVCVSRFAHHKGKIAHALVEAAALLREGFPQAVVLLVGEGPEQEALRAHAASVNARLGRHFASERANPAAMMVGPRQDVERFMNLGAAVVATANTALEAMACSAPTIAAGRSGYLGPVAPDSFEPGRAACFGDHGRVPRRPTAQQLAYGIRSILADREHASQVAAANRRIIASCYNIERMADSIERIYEKVLGNP